MKERFLPVILALWILPAIARAQVHTRQPVVNFAVVINDPQVVQNLSDELPDIATDIAKDLPDHLRNVLDFIAWTPVNPPDIGQADALLKIQILRRREGSTYIAFEVDQPKGDQKAERQSFLQDVSVELWAANNYARPTDDRADLEREVETTLEKYLDNAISSEKLRTDLLQVLPVARGVDKIFEDGTTYFVIGIPWDKLLPGIGTIFSLDFDVPLRDISLHGTLYLAPSEKYQNMIVASPMHECNLHHFNIPLKDVNKQKSGGPCDPTDASAEHPDLFKHLTPAILANATVHIVHYTRGIYDN